MLTVKDKKIVQTEKSDIEKILKEKMNDLSDSVDCFDRISERVFVENLQGIEDSAYVVTELENVTGKSQAPRFFKWTAIAAAAAVAIVVIPNTDFGRQLLSDVASDTDSSDFQAIVRELDTELLSESYRVTDVPLDYYIKNDVLVTPLFCCPFEDCGRDDVNVRIFTKQIDGIDTTQVYAVLYTGTYTENNFIAAAESKYKFTAEDMTLKFDDKIQYLNSAESVLEKHFYGNDTMGNIYNDERNISVGSFVNTVITKSDTGEINKCSNEFIIWHEDNVNYFYDIIFSDAGNENYYGEDMWKCSLYYNGNSSFPVIPESVFVKTDLINSPETGVDDTNFTFVYPFEYDGNYPDVSDDGLIMTITTNPLSSYQINLPIPVNAEALLSYKAYFPVAALSEIDKITVYSNNFQNVINTNDIIDKLQKEQAEIYERRMEEIESLIIQEQEMLEVLEKERQRTEKIYKESVHPRDIPEPTTKSNKN